MSYKDDFRLKRSQENHKSLFYKYSDLHDDYPYSDRDGAFAHYHAKVYGEQELRKRILTSDERKKIFERSCKIYNYNPSKK